MPRSEKPRIAMIELIVIQRPYLSVPRYFKVSGTETRTVRMLTAFENPNDSVVRSARLYRSFDLPSAVDVSNGLNRAIAHIRLATFTGAVENGEDIKDSIRKT